MQDASNKLSAADLLPVAFGSGAGWLGWLIDAAAAQLDLRPHEREVLALRQLEHTLPTIAALVGQTTEQVERTSGVITAGGHARSCPTILAAALRRVDAFDRSAFRVAVLEAEPGRADAWHRAVDFLGDAVVLVTDPRLGCDIAVCSPFAPRWTDVAATASTLVLSACDPAVRSLANHHPTAMFADPLHDDLPLILAHAVARVSWGRTPNTWPLPAAWLRAAFLDRLERAGAFTPRQRELVDTWIDAPDHKSMADRLCLSVRSTQSRASAVCERLGIRSLVGLPFALAQSIDRAEPSRAEPSRAEPSRAEPSRAEPSRAERSMSCVHAPSR